MNAVLIFFGNLWLLCCPIDACGSSAIRGFLQGSRKQHAMKCMVCEHEWSDTPDTKRTAFTKNGNSGCPNCHTQKVGNEIYNLLLTENKIKLLEEYKGAKKHHAMKCMVCEHEWSATPSSKRQALKKNGVGGCPQCSTQQREDNTISTLKEYLIDTNLIFIRIEGRDQSTNKLLARVKNVNCNHEFVSRSNNCLLYTSPSPRDRG